MKNAIARLLATENLTVKTGNLKTAYFDTKNRVLGLPDWSAENPSVFNLLVGHEVGHALFTPHIEEGALFEKKKALPHSYVNITEDNRIERMIQTEYPGLAYHFNKGYDNLLKREFFGDISDTTKLKLIDKVNLISKLGNRVAITLTDEELHLYNQTNVAMTFEAAVEAAEAILEYDRENPPEQDDDNEQASTDKSEECADSEEGDNDAGESNAESQPDDGEESKSGESQTGEGGEESNAEAPATDDGEEEAPTDEEASTDEAFQKNMEGLVEDEEGELDTFSINEVKPELIDAAVTTYAQYDAMYDNHATAKLRDSEEAGLVRIRDIKRAVQPAVKAFEQNKAAESWKHAQTANTGRINVNKLHSYKIDDDIFLRTTRHADAKSHGMFIMLDLSQSMHSALAKVIDQALHSVMFCKAVGIPFEVYTFTSTNDATKLRTSPDEQLDFGDLATIKTANVVQRTSSTLNRQQFERSLLQLMLLAPKSRGWSHHPLVPVDAMRGTPLLETLIVTATLLAKFKARNNIQKPSFVFITDGDGFSPKVWTDTFENRPVTKGLRRHPWDKQPNDGKFTVSSIRYETDAFLNFTVLGKVIKTRSGNQSAVQEDLLKGIMKMLNVKCVGFYISYKLKEGINSVVDSNIHATSGSRRLRYAETAHALAPTEKFMKQAKKDNLAIFNNILGYDVLYVLPVDKANDEKTLDATTSATALKDFRAMAKSRNKNKIVLTAFGKFIAQ